MEFRNEQHRLAVKAAFLRITADQSWTTMRELADEVVYLLEQKSLREDDEEKAKTYRHDARGARRFWEQWLLLMESVKAGDSAMDDTFNEVVM